MINFAVSWAKEEAKIQDVDIKEAKRRVGRYLLKLAVEFGVTEEDLKKIQEGGVD